MKLTGLSALLFFRSECAHPCCMEPPVCSIGFGAARCPPVTRNISLGYRSINLDCSINLKSRECCRISEIPYLELHRKRQYSLRQTNIRVGLFVTES